MKIDDIQPGQQVIYVPGHAHGDRGHKDCERGVVTSKNETVVFVRYGDKQNSQATSPEDLEPVWRRVSA